MKKHRIVLLIFFVILIIFVSTNKKAKLILSDINSSVSFVRNKQFDKEIAKARKAGLPMSISEIKITPPKPEDNAEPFYRILTNKINKQETSEGDVEKRSRHLLSGKDDLAKVNTWLQQHHTLIQTAHKAASKPHYYEKHKQDPLGMIDYYEASGIRRACRLLSIESTAMAKSGNAIKAVDNVSSGFKIANHAHEDIGIAPWIVSVACTQITLQTLQNILIISHGDPKVAAEINKVIDNDCHTYSLSNAFKTELAIQTAIMDTIRKSEPKKIGFKGDSFEKRLLNSLVESNGAILITNMRVMVNVADLPYPQSKNQAYRINSELRSHSDIYIIAKIFDIHPTKAIDKQTDIIAKMRVLHTAADLFIYKSKHGSFPDRLEQAIPNPPLDPFDLKPLRYRKEGKGFVVYSIGETLKYDGRYVKDDKTIIPAVKPGDESQTIHEIVYRYAGK